MNFDSKKTYITLKKEITSRFEEKRSVFLAHAAPIMSEDEAQEFIKRKKNEFSDARHNVFAYFIGGGNTARYSDDGEPQGTAGIPVLEVIKKSGCSDVCIVVTRYFGGTLLGAGGLVRAYSSAARLAIDEAGIITYELFDVIEILCSYSDSQKISHELEKPGAKIDNIEYSNEVKITAGIKSDLFCDFTNRINELTAGRAHMKPIGERYDFG